MIDPFVILAPFLLLAVIALLRFVGCATVLGIDDVLYTPAAMASPTFDPPPGIFNTTQMVRLSSPDPIAVLYYTVDGALPTNPPTGSTQAYGGPITISTFTLIRAIATRQGFQDSPEAGGNYIISGAPTATPPTITGFDPPDATVGDPAFELTVKGSNFAPALTVKFGNTPVSVTSVIPLKLQIPANAPELANPGTFNVTVTNPGGQTASAPFTIFLLVTVTFSPDPSGTPGPLPVPYRNLNFDASWAWERGIPQDLLNHIFLVSGRFSGTFQFVGPSGRRLLKRIKVSWGSATPGTGTITISDDNSPQQTASLTIMNGQMQQTVETKWTKTATTITVSFPVADTLTIDEIDYQGPP